MKDLTNISTITEEVPVVSSPNISSNNSPAFAPDRIIVKLKPSVSSDQVNSLQSQMQVSNVSVARNLGVQIWEIPSGNIEEIISTYENSPYVEYIEPDYIITIDKTTSTKDQLAPDSTDKADKAIDKTTSTKDQLATDSTDKADKAIDKTTSTKDQLATDSTDKATAIITATEPNDPQYNQLWGLNNTGQTGGTPDADIDATEAWDIQRGDPNLVIGVIDTGVDYNHPDLRNNIWTNPGEIAGDGIDNDGNGYIDDIRGWDFAYNDSDPMDFQGHGTHVAGTIAAQGNNGIGVTGVAWQAKIMPLKFLDDNGSGYLSNALLAIDYATGKGVKITNNSWGGGGYSQALYDAINRANQQGSLFVAAASNDSMDNDQSFSYPSSYDLPNIISVASTTSTDGLSSFSNYGLTTVDLGAPGSDIYSTLPGNQYGVLSGTSMASPHVAGATALLWSQNPTWTAQQIKDRLLATVDPIVALAGKTVTGGRLNIFNALNNGTAGPANDNFVNRSVLTGNIISGTGTNVGATGETGEPTQSGTTNSSWWSWTAPATRSYVIDTKNSNFDTYLSVFTGNTVDQLTLINADDDSGGNYTSLVTLNATAGTTYQIAVDGYSETTGEIQLNIATETSATNNDNFVDSITIEGTTTTVTGTNEGFTGEIGEPTQSGTTNSSWWSWTAPSTGSYTIDTTNSDFDTYLSVFTGDAVDQLTLIDANDDSGGSGSTTSAVTLAATAGTTYRIAVDGFSEATGAIQLNIEPSGPVNDYFENSVELTGRITSGTGNNVGATEEIGEPTQSGTTNSSWWSWTAPSSGNYTIDTTNSDFDTYLSVFTGNAVDQLTLINADDDSGGNYTSLVTLNATAGTTYRIAVDGYAEATGEIQLNIASRAATAPANDNFANRSVLTGSITSGTGTNVGATEQTGEPQQSGIINSSWWSWTAPSSGNYIIDTTNSDFDTYLSVFTGNTVDQLTLIGANDDIGVGIYGSIVNLDATAGTTYQIAVDGFSDATGEIELNIAPGGPVNDNFVDRSVLEGSATSVTGTNVGSTEEIGEPSQNGTINSSWWTWTAPATGSYVIDTKNSDFDTYLSVFTGNTVDQLTLVSADDDSGGSGTSSVTLDVIGGTTYQIAVDGFGSSTGEIQLNINSGTDGNGGTTGPDNLIGTAGPDTIDGLAGNDTISGLGGNDRLIGGPDNDRISGGGGYDTMIGGTGNDTYIVNSPRDRIVEALNAGTDIVLTTANYTLPANVENLTLQGTRAINGTGNTLANTIAGNGAANRITGQAGNDNLNGRAGNDILNGGAGNDTLTGGTGADRFLYTTNTAFTTASIGVDTITDFVISQNDKIVLDKTTFNGLRSATGAGFSVSGEFARVTSDAAAATSSALIVYNTTNGSLFYNPNGTTDSFGTGGKFAVLSNRPSLTASQFIIQA